MNRKILSIAVLLLAAVMAAPLAQARDGGHGRDGHRSAPVYREHHVARHYYHPGRHHGWHRPGHYYRHHYYHYYHRPAPRHYYRHHYPHHPAR